MVDCKHNIEIGNERFEYCFKCKILVDHVLGLIHREVTEEAAREFMKIAS